MIRFKFLKRFFQFLDSETLSYLYQRLLKILWLIFFFASTIYILTNHNKLIAFIPFCFVLFFLYKILFEVRTQDIKRGKIQDFRITGASHDIAFKPIEDSNMFCVVVIVHKYEYKDIYKTGEAQETNGTYTWKNKVIGKKVEKQKDRQVISFEDFPLTRIKSLVLTWRFLREKNNSVFNLKYIRFHVERMYLPFYRRFSVLPIYEPLPENTHPTLIAQPE